MTPERFTQIRERADLSRAQLAKVLRIKEVKTIYRYEHGERPISGPVSLLMEMIEDGRL
jgi:DNA-binding transcriptional regulator YiaG